MTGSTALSSEENITTQDGKATIAEGNYQLSTVFLKLTATDTIHSLLVFINVDAKSEADETFTVHLSGATGATISDADGLGTITNDDAAPTLAIDDVTHNEGNSDRKSDV